MIGSHLRFLADENCDHGVVRRLRSEGYDVVALCEVSARTVDREVMALAAQEGRILITEDKDFDWSMRLMLIQQGSS